jgi:adenine-specific DNA-methyltransferase
MIKYLGSKRKLVEHIANAVDELQGVKTILDLFSGTSRVGYRLKQGGYSVHANDMAHYAECIAKCYIETDKAAYQSDVDLLVEEANKVAEATVNATFGWWTKNYCINSRYFHPMNGIKIEAVRNWIDKQKLSPELHNCMMVSLMEAADRVDSTVGIQMAYLKQWSKRSTMPLKLRSPILLPNGSGTYLASRTDALSLLESDYCTDHNIDLIYMDPPYNQHSYSGNYHLWSTLVLWDNPTVYGVALKREDVRVTKSNWNSKAKIVDEFNKSIESAKSKYVIVSYSNEGYLTPMDIATTLSNHGKINIKQFQHNRYVGSQIGIYNNLGAVVGTKGKKQNTEYLFILEK